MIRTTHRALTTACAPLALAATVLLATPTALAAGADDSRPDVNKAQVEYQERVQLAGDAEAAQWQNKRYIEHIQQQWLDELANPPAPIQVADQPSEAAGDATAVWQLALSAVGGAAVGGALVAGAHVLSQRSQTRRVDHGAARA